MQFVQNFPFFCILLTLICAVISSVLRARAARRLTAFAICAVFAMNACVLLYTLRTGDSYAYMMGHFPAPWGNEIRVGVLETLSMQVFLAVIGLSFACGLRSSIVHLEDSKYNIFCILVDLTMLSLLALVYTNDIFTAYVFIEINTIAAAGLVMIRQSGRSLVAGARYLIMNMLGSSLFLIGIVILYIITGHLLMTPAHEAVAKLAESGEYTVPLAIVVALISVGLAMKSALFPFDKWLPGAYGNSTPTGSAILSSIVSKGYIFLLIKIYVRVIGVDVIAKTGINDILFVCGACGMVMGSVNAMRAKTTRMMVAYSSVAQIGYIYLALGIGTRQSLACALWHVLAHTLTKSMLFLSQDALDESSGRTHLRRDLRGGFYRSPVAAVAFTVGAANLVGIPLLPVFMTKVQLAAAAAALTDVHTAVVLTVMAISTLLNAQYFLGTACLLYMPGEGEVPSHGLLSRLEALCFFGFIGCNLALGIFSQPILAQIFNGLANFA